MESLPKALENPCRDRWPLVEQLEEAICCEHEQPDGRGRTPSPYAAHPPRGPSHQRSRQRQDRLPSCRRASRAGRLPPRRRTPFPACLHGSASCPRRSQPRRRALRSAGDPTSSSLRRAARLSTAPASRPSEVAPHEDNSRRARLDVTLRLCLAFCARLRRRAGGRGRAVPRLRRRSGYGIGT